MNVAAKKEGANTNAGEGATGVEIKVLSLQKCQVVRLLINTEEEASAICIPKGKLDKRYGIAPHA